MLLLLVAKPSKVGEYCPPTDGGRDPPLLHKGDLLHQPPIRRLHCASRDSSHKLIGREFVMHQGEDLHPRSFIDVTLGERIPYPSSSEQWGRKMVPTPQTGYTTINSGGNPPSCMLMMIW